MATGTEHYQEAERLLREQGKLAAAQVHATLALAAATALGRVTDGGPTSADRSAWIAAASEHPAMKLRIREAEAADLRDMEGI